MIQQVNRKSMTPQEKAKELFDKYADEFNFDDTYRGYREQSKQCALITVNEIMKECYNWAGGENIEYDIKRFQYWQQVKEEIEKL